MKSALRFWRWVWALTVLSAVAGALWYGSLNDAQKANVKNFARQVPDLPARFMV